MKACIHCSVLQDLRSSLLPIKCSVSARSARSCWILQTVKPPHWVTVTCCIFLIDGKVFIPWGGYSDPCMSEGLTEPGTGRGLTEPGSLCTEPPLPSDWPSFFLISFLSLALRFWNQIFTWKRTIGKVSGNALLLLHTSKKKKEKARK